MKWRDEYDLPRRFSGHVSPFVTEIAVALVMVATAIGLRMFIDIFFKDVVVFALIFPAVVGATLLAGPRAGAIVVVFCQLLSWYFLLPVKDSFAFATWGNCISLIVTTLAMLTLLWSVAGFRKAARQAADLEAQRAEGLVLALRELDHRTRNNFQLAGALLHLHGSRHEDARVRQELERAANRLNSIAMIHANLSGGRSDVSHVVLSEYLDEICDHLRSGLTREGIYISTDLAPLPVSHDCALHLGLIVNELVVNALKHAFPGGAGWIAISARADGRDLVVRVSDNGVGLAPSAPSASGIGGKLVDLLAHRIGARLSRPKAEGTVVEVHMPLEMAAISEPALGGSGAPAQAGA